ncbi:MULTISPECIES: response regulator [unclassified Roseovarius]|uniref:response regulator n=1 Tax=unclassified Roseovarius TaxID=2614913 RepID=UPI00273D00C2|nr:MULTISPECIES: response regulator [unclassified Roseovarius]
MNVASQKDVKLLHVEDSELDARALQRAFKKLDIELDLARAKDGIEALELLGAADQEFAQEAQTIVLLDINMPRMNGIEFLKELRNDPALHHTPVFVLTTSERPSDIRDAYKHNVAGYIVKPLSSSSFVERISQWRQFLSIIELPGTA